VAGAPSLSGWPTPARVGQRSVRLREPLGQRAEASPRCVPVDSWCTEGYDTADLQGGEGPAGRPGRAPCSPDV